MSNTTPPPPGFPPPFLPQAPPPKKNHTNAIIIGAAVAIIATIITTGIVVVQATNDDSKPATTTSTASSDPDEDIVTPAAEEEPEPTYAALTPADFTMKLRTTERQCFGSAGCNVTVEPTLSYVGEWNGVDPDAVYSITYEIRGDKSGPVIETAELSDETSLSYTQTLISTVSSSKKVSVKITDVVMQGG